MDADLTRASAFRAIPAVMAAVAVGVLAIGASVPQARQAGGVKASIAKSAIARALAEQSQIVVTADSLAGAAGRARADDWSPTVNRTLSRGGADVYAAVAPAVAVVRTPTGHGTGFFVTADGLLVTNHHVIGAGLDHAGDASFASVHTGRLGDDGLMALDKTPRRAFFLKSDPTRDLALLKLEGATGAAAVPFLKLADRGPRPGLDCAIVGHPASGMLWTYRPGQVSAVGDSSRDIVDVLVALLAATTDQRAQIERQLQGEPVRRIFLSSASANPGDSGGPVVDQQARVIGVTFAGPSNVGLRSFTYHIHLDELREFLKSVPASPTLRAPDPWETGTQWTLGHAITPKTDRPDALLSGDQTPKGVQPVAFYIDLDLDSPAPAGDQALQQLVGQRKWDFEFALDIRGTGYVAYYDTNNDARVDLILSNEVDTSSATERMTLDAKGLWHSEKLAPGRVALLSPTYFKDPKLQARMKLLRANTQEWPWQ